MAVLAWDDGTYFLVHEPDGGRWAPERARIVTKDGRVVSRRRHGSPGRVEVADESGSLVATWLRAAAAAGSAFSGAIRVRLAADGEPVLTRDPDGTPRLDLNGPAVAASPSHHPIDAQVAALSASLTQSEATPAPELGGRAARKVLFFESLMNSDMPHNDCELSQGVLHMASALRGTGSEPVLCNVKMSITGSERPVVGLERLERALAPGDVDLVCITLLEGYWDGVIALVGELRRLGCRAHVAVGGVMPTLTPEHVAAHLPDVSFVCRGAGEYFVPRLAQIVGDRSSIDRPLESEQRAALLALDGLIAVDRAGRHLISANSAKTVRVESLDAVELDLGLFERRHLAQGVELSTSRGCIHKCSFCSIIGRQSYQARSAGGVFDTLEKYRARYREIFADEVPGNAFRLHISDDDFACDKPRARAFFDGLEATPFRLASVQVSVADLCRRGQKGLLPEPDPEIMDAIRAECFADASAEIPERDFVADHKSRRWSSYLQIGVETFSDKELDRLGKGYGREHVRVIVDELAKKAIHLDAYLILANADTTVEDLVDSVEELCRLKLRHPKWFHVRFPIVPRLVSYFPSASHRRMVRKGQSDALRLRGRASVPSHPELDYPFVDADEPRDPWVRAVDESVFTDEGFYTGTLEKMRERLLELWQEGKDVTPEREALLRRLDDRARGLVFEQLSAASRSAPREEKQALGNAESVLGPKEQWLPAFARFDSQAPARLVVIPTWQCELRCTYCYIPKQDGRVMPVSTLERSVDLLLSSSRSELLLQFFGGEALLEWGLVRHGIEYGEQRARVAGKKIRFIVSSNGWSLDAEKIDWLSRHPVKLELSLDGVSEVQNHARPARLRTLDSYQNGIAPRARQIVDAGLDYDVIMVVLPHNVHRLAEGFFHLADLGFRRIQVNFALGVMWRPEHKRAFADGLFRIGEGLRERWARGQDVTMVNLEAALFPVRLNGEITVDWDGAIYSGNGFLHENEHKQRLRIGHLDDLCSFDRYWLDAPGNDFLLQWGYPADVTANNRSVGAILTSFVRWMRKGEARTRTPTSRTSAVP
jgi:Radical SAM superfamily/B12 binding domain